MLSLGSTLFSQTINFKGCVPLFENQLYVLNTTGVDSFGKKIYVTTPVIGDQPCGGLGTCEFKIEWNETNGRWEFLADSGNGDFVEPYLIYYSTAQNTSADNPPNADIGSWVENTAVTEGNCGGNLTTGNSTFTGDVRTVNLALNEFNKSNIMIYPNPATDFINIIGIKVIKSIKILSLEGKLISTLNGVNKINVSKLSTGVYLLEVETEKTLIKRIKFIKK